MSDEIFIQLENAKAELDALQPLPSETLRELDAWYDVDLTYTSNAIEGNTLTRNETAIVIEKGITVRGKTLHDHNEAVDHYTAVQFMRSLARDSRPIGENDIRQLHALVVARTLETAGQYANRPRFVTTSAGRHVFPDPAEILPRMAALAAKLTRPASARLAFEAHLEFVAIHPFEDGNGRTGRLLMNALLLRAGHLPLLIGPEVRPDYIDSIEQAQESGDPEPYSALLASWLLSQTQQLLQRLKG